MITIYTDGAMCCKVVMIMLLAVLCSCNTSQPGADHETSDTGSFRERYIVRDKEHCDQEQSSERITDSLLWGTWQEILQWDLYDTCWYGLEPIDRKVAYTFSPSKYTVTETYSDTTKNYFMQGVFWVKSRGDSNFLELAIRNGDTLLRHGDTFLLATYLVYCTDPQKLKIRARSNTGEFDQKMIELEKK